VKRGPVPAFVYQDILWLAKYTHRNFPVDELGGIWGRSLGRENRFEMRRKIDMQSPQA